MNQDVILFNGKAEMILPNIGHKVDLVLTSPPYNMNLRIQKGKYKSRVIGDSFSTKYDGFDDNLPIEEYHRLHTGILKELLRVSPLVFYNMQIVTGSKRSLFQTIGEFHENLKDIIIWNKLHGQPAMRDGVLNSQYELLLVLERDPGQAISRRFKSAEFDRGTLSNVWNIRREASTLEGHNAVFPTKLVRRVLRNFAKKGQVILDPFMGTGRTGKVSVEEGMKFIGIEAVKHVFEHAKEEIEMAAVGL